MDALAELNQALAVFQPEPLADFECRFYYNPTTHVGTRIGGIGDREPFVNITYDEYQLMKSDVASKFYLSKTGKVKPVTIAKGMRKLLEYSSTGVYRTIKDCMIFADPSGADTYQRREFDYD